MAVLLLSVVNQNIFVGTYQFPPVYRFLTSASVPGRILIVKMKNIKYTTLCYLCITYKRNK